MNGEAMDRFFESGILALVLGILVFAPLAMGAVAPALFLVVQALILAVMFLWALRFVVTPKIKFYWPPLCWPVLAFALYAIARYFTAPIEYVARFEVIQTLLYAFLFFAIVNNITSRESTPIICLILVFLATGISCYGIWQFLTHSRHVWNEISPYAGRATGTYISPNNFSCFLEMTMPLALAFLLAGRVKSFTRMLLCYALLAMATALAMSFSRGGWVAAAAGIIAVLCILLCHPKHRLAAFMMIVVLAISGGLFVTSYLSRTIGYIERIESIERDNSVDLEFRRDMWKAADRMWADNFWLGVGPAHYDYRFRQYRSERVQARPDRAHNDYLNLLADWGTIGGIIVAGGIIIFAVGLVKTVKAVWPDKSELGRGMSDRFAFFVGASAALLALAIHSIIDYNLHIPANALIGLTLLALLTAQWRFAMPGHKIEAGVVVRIFLAMVLAVAIGCFGFCGYRRAVEASWQARASDTNLPWLERARLLERAFAAEPTDFQVTYDIAEFYRQESFLSNPDYESQAQTAMQWYSRGMKLNPFDGYNWLGYGICLDWLDRHDEAQSYFDRAQTLDPNGYFTADWVAWHYVQAGDYPAARVCLQRAIRLGPDVNPMASSYWDIIQNKLVQQASGQPRLPPGY
jgi:O-antigen ligase